MHVTKGRSHGEAVRDGVQVLVCVSHFLRLGVQLGRIDAGVVHTVFLTAGDAELDFQGHAHSAHALVVLRTRGDVFFEGLLTQVDHVRAVERTAGSFKVTLAGVQQPVDPWQEFAGAVVGVQDHGHFVRLSEGMYVVCGRDAAEHGGTLLLVAQAFACVELGAAVGELHNHG